MRYSGTEHGTVLAVWYCSGGMVLFWRYGTVLAVWYCSGGMVLFWRYGTVLAVWYCSGGMVLFSEVVVKIAGCVECSSHGVHYSSKLRNQITTGRVITVSTPVSTL